MNKKQEDEKAALTIDEQVVYLKENKNVVFENEGEAKEYLLKYSYTDVINPLKVLFCSSYDTNKNCHKYTNKTNWSDIQRLHQRIKEVEGIVLNELLLLELQLKSSFCEWLTTQIKDKRFENFGDFIDKLKINSIDKIKLKHKYEMTFYNNYNKEGYAHKKYGDYWWLLVNSFSFGDLQRLLDFKFIDNKEISVLESVIRESTNDKIKKILKKGKSLRTYVILRNALSHQTNLLIFLDQPIYKNDTETYDKRVAVLQYILKYVKDVKTERYGLLSRYEAYRNSRITSLDKIKL